MTVIESKATKDFFEVLESMRRHYKTGTNRDFKMPNIYNAYESKNELSAESSDAEVQEIQSGFQVQNTSFGNTSQQEISDATVLLQKADKSDSVAVDTAQDAFSAQMDSIGAAQKARSAATIDDYVNKMKLAGAGKDPEIQAGIAKTTSASLGFFNSIVDKVSTFVTSIVSSVTTWLSNAWTSIKNTFSKIGSAIASWFGF